MLTFQNHPTRYLIVKDLDRVFKRGEAYLRRPARGVNDLFRRRLNLRFSIPAEALSSVGRGGNLLASGLRVNNFLRSFFDTFRSGQGVSTLPAAGRTSYRSPPAVSTAFRVLLSIFSTRPGWTRVLPQRERLSSRTSNRSQQLFSNPRNFFIIQGAG